MSETIVEHNCGIYRIINIKNKSIYIGSSKNLKQRKIDHYKLLRHNKHSNGKLQNSFNKYGEQSFRFEILLYCEEYNLELFENICLDGLNPYFNIEKSSIRRRGDYIHSEKTIKKLSESHKGKPSNRLGCKLEQNQIDILRNVNMGNQNAGKVYNTNLMSPDGNIFTEPIKNITRFCRENNIKSVGTFLQFIKGKKASYLGWRIL